MDSTPSVKYSTVEEIKTFRVEIDSLIQRAVFLYLPYAESGKDFATRNILRNLAPQEVFLALKEAKMWLGCCLEAMNTPFPTELADKAQTTSDGNTPN